MCTYYYYRMHVSSRPARVLPRGAPRAWSGDKPHVGIAGVTLHTTRSSSIVEDTHGYSFRLVGQAARHPFRMTRRIDLKRIRVFLPSE